MSENAPDNRYAEWWEPPFVLIIIVLTAMIMNACHESQLRDLQRRIAVLEQKR